MLYLQTEPSVTSMVDDAAEVGRYNFIGLVVDESECILLRLLFMFMGVRREWHTR